MISHWIEKVQKIHYDILMIKGSDIKKNLGEIVRELRLQKNITQEKLSEYLELQPRSITAIENGKTFIFCEVLEKLANYFDVDPSIFFIKKTNIYDPNQQEYYSKIKRLLRSFKSDKLKKIYNILLILLNE